MLERDLDSQSGSHDPLDALGVEEEGVGEALCTPVCVALVVAALLVAVVLRGVGMSGASRAVSLGLAALATASLVMLGVLLAGVPPHGPVGGVEEAERERHLDQVYVVLVAAVGLTAVAAFVVLSSAPGSVLTQ